VASKVVFILIVVAISIQPMIGKNRNPLDYPQKAKVLSFSQQRGNGSLTRCDATGTGMNCLGLAMVHHVLEIEIEGQHYTVSCHHCDPLLPGQIYPAKIQLKDMEILMIHEKGRGKWGQDNYKILHMEAMSNTP
jgi:hypothetical protein